MSGVRRYEDESGLDDMVCPPEPRPKTPYDSFMKEFEAERRREEMAIQAHKEAREKRSRNFDISKGSAKGESPEEEY